MEQISIRKLNFDNKFSAYTIEEYMQNVKEFHGSVAPGLLIGGFMVDMALKNLPAGEFFDAIAETKTCLPDAIQLLTPCTIGNGWLRVINISRYALCMYEKKDGNGIRVHLDSSKIEAWPEIKSWFFKLKHKKEQNYKLLIDQIREAGEGICGMRKIKVKSEFLVQKQHGRKVVNCASCGEAFKIIDGGICHACLGESPYMV